MQTAATELLGIEYPIFAFSHCRDVVVEISKAGGIGVLGAVGFTPERLREELDWIDAHIGDARYGVDLVIPQKYEGKGEEDPEALRAQLASMIPDAHRDFVNQLLQSHAVPESPDSAESVLMGWTSATAMPQLAEALRHDKVSLIANALGTPPQDVIDQVHRSGRLVAALCGKVRQALSHKQAGVDIIIAQGHEGGGHTGEVGSIVLWPQVAQAVAPVPMLAAGGIATGGQIAAAMAVGAAGVWTGSLWLTVEEASAEPEQKASLLRASSEDTVRSRSWTGKPCRMLRNEWTEAWAREDTPDPLGMPLQGMLTYQALRRTSRYAASGQTQQVAFAPTGQVIGQINEVESCRNVMARLLNEYVDASERLGSLLSEA